MRAGVVDPNAFGGREEALVGGVAGGVKSMMGGLLEEEEEEAGQESGWMIFNPNGRASLWGDDDDKG